MTDNHPSFDDTWYPIDTAPTDGLMILGKMEDGTEDLIYYMDGKWQNMTSRDKKPVQWRYTRKDQYLRWQQAK